jgi:hypothetical protein
VDSIKNGFPNPKKHKVKNCDGDSESPAVSVNPFFLCEPTMSFSVDSDHRLFD